MCFYCTIVHLNVICRCIQFSFPINPVFSITEAQLSSYRAGVEHGLVISPLKDILPAASPRETCTEGIITHCLTDG